MLCCPTASLKNEAHFTNLHNETDLDFAELLIQISASSFMNADL